MTAAEADLKKAESARKDALERKDTLSSEITALKAEQKALEQAGAEKEKLTAKRRQLIDSKEAFHSLIADLASLEAQRNILKEKNAYLEATAKSEQLQHDYEAKNKAFLDEQAGIIASRLAPGTPCPVCGSLEHPQLAVLSENAPTEADVKKARKEYEKAQKETEKASADASKQIDTFKSKLPYEDKAAAEQEKKSLETQLKALQTALSQAREHFSGCKEKLTGIQATITQLRKQLADSVEIETDALEAEKAELVAQKNAVTAKQKVLHARITANESAITHISEKSAEMDKLEKQYTWMKALSDTANGSLAGKNKIMLETYIQTTYFDRILERTNIRLSKMSGGQYDLKRRTEASNQGKTGLELDIIDHINTTERSVNTLSGGEAFLASLALALGLSDEVQMSTGIHLDTLFVDEGFGSLDSEALSKAYSTLAGLTDGKRLVGIISHISELKERIDKQIVVTKDRSGGSEAEIHV